MNQKQQNKTIVFSFDGTGNEPSDVRNYKSDESITNIYKLHLLLGGGSKQDVPATQTEGGNLQLNYYYPGIGTREDLGKAPFLGGLLARLQKWVNYNFAPSFGDASRILDDAHRDFLGCNHQPADKVAIFGFSRGAALAVEDAEMIAAMRELGRLEGISASPEGGATLCAVRTLVQRGVIDRDEHVVLFNTGGALKYLELLRD